jgi:replicative DNA helicase
VSLPEISPHDLDAERAVLGAVLVNNAALVAVERIVQPSDFFRDAHCELFRQMLALAGESQAIYTITLRHALGPDRLERVGGPSYITSLIDGLPRFQRRVDRVS